MRLFLLKGPSSDRWIDPWGLLDNTSQRWFTSTNTFGVSAKPHFYPRTGCGYPIYFIISLWHRVLAKVPIFNNNTLTRECYATKMLSHPGSLLQHGLTLMHTPHFIEYITTYPCWDLSHIMLVKEALVCSWNLFLLLPKYLLTFSYYMA